MCESARINFEAFYKVVKRGCRCRTKLCKNWECTCDTDQDTEEQEECQCPSCDCDSCRECKVCLLNINTKFLKCFISTIDQTIKATKTSGVWVFEKNITHYKRHNMDHPR